MSAAPMSEAAEDLPRALKRLAVYMRVTVAALRNWQVAHKKASIIMNTMENKLAPKAAPRVSQPLSAQHGSGTPWTMLTDPNSPLSIPELENRYEQVFEAHVDSPDRRLLSALSGNSRPREQ